MEFQYFFLGTIYLLTQVFVHFCLFFIDFYEIIFIFKKIGYIIYRQENLTMIDFSINSLVSIFTHFNTQERMLKWINHVFCQ